MLVGAFRRRVEDLALWRATQVRDVAVEIDPHDYTMPPERLGTQDSESDDSKQLRLAIGIQMRLDARTLDIMQIAPRRLLSPAPMVHRHINAAHDALAQRRRDAHLAGATHAMGHDALFPQHAQSPTTVFAVKDRVTGHNPLAALTLRSYYRRLKSK